MQPTNKNRRWQQLRAMAKNTYRHSVASKPRCMLIRGDSRVILRTVPGASVDCIITSPPYGDLKNYGRANQLGYGQHLVKQYLPDMQAVLTELHRIAKIGASLWLVLDAFKTNGEALLLPWELARRAQQCGWTLHDIIVWDKGKSLPWSHDGKFRSVCEFVVL